MSAALEVPRQVVEAAERHYLRSKWPLLYKPRGRTEWALAALPGAGKRFVVLLDPETPPAQALFAAALACGKEQDDDAILGRLAEAAATVLDDVPRRFTCDGRVVGTWEIVVGSVTVRGPVALSCLSWTLREQRTGFFLRLEGG